MKIRSLLILANTISLVVILVFLSISYVKMFISPDIIILLSLITLGAGLLSFGIHLTITSPLLKSVKQMSKEAGKMASGDFDVKVTEAGPLEIKELAANFNHMSSRIEEMFGELKESEKFKSELIANVSHDLRTPLSSIHSFVSALNDDIIEDPKDRKRYFETILSETGKLSLLIEEVLEFSQLENRKLSWNPHPTPIDQLLIDTLGQFEPRIQEKEIHVKVEYDDSLPLVPLMPLHIKRVMTNFIQNALSFSPDHTSLDIRAVKKEEQVEFSVTDQGKGIPIEEQDSIFERFYRVEKSRNKAGGGSGLGLSISKEIIEIHGGSIGVESDGQSGSTFWFQLPLEKSGEERR
ncbi:HAMP domain-containing sensor histidine kinase [Rossellomorea arthrocnemi]|jgi:two-component system, OmpR family, sensor histidine kinase SaeS|uniref:HAMP domain-containing sensor histidine kinase n=1 Tax=Rossellomorea arthrocnemi TaxID=2769542 RepID=UPI0019199C34|nr:HAMP domain-containing sensor histidine kinase [Rossellomorea arthrocnemi]